MLELSSLFLFCVVAFPRVFFAIAEHIARAVQENNALLYSLASNNKQKIGKLLLFLAISLSNTFVLIWTIQFSLASSTTSRVSLVPQSIVVSLSSLVYSSIHFCCCCCLYFDAFHHRRFLQVTSDIAFPDE